MPDKNLLADCVEWDTINWSKALTFWERHLPLDNKNYNCLELGGRRGGLSLWLALKGNNVICSDLQDPYPEASPLHERYACRSRIQYEAIDATNIPYEDHFDIVAFKSILGGISRDGKQHLNQVVIDQVFKALKTGGKLLFAENLQASPVHTFLRRRVVRWGSSWNYLNLNELPPLLHAFGAIEYQTAGFLGAFGRSEIQRTFLGKLDTLFFDWSIPDNLKYIAFGVATKI